MEDDEEVDISEDDEDNDEAVVRVPASLSETLAQQNASLATSLASLIDNAGANPALFAAHGIFPPGLAFDHSGVLKVPAHRPGPPPPIGASPSHPLLAPSATGLSPAHLDYAAWLCRPGMMQLPGAAAGAYLPIPANILAARLGGEKENVGSVHRKEPCDLVDDAGNSSQQAKMNSPELIFILCA